MLFFLKENAPTSARSLAGKDPSAAGSAADPKEPAAGPCSKLHAAAQPTPMQFAFHTAMSSPQTRQPPHPGAPAPRTPCAPAPAHAGGSPTCGAAPGTAGRLSRRSGMAAHQGSLGGEPCPAIRRSALACRPPARPPRRQHAPPACPPISPSHLAAGRPCTLTLAVADRASTENSRLPSSKPRPSPVALT